MMNLRSLHELTYFVHDKGDIRSYENDVLESAQPSSYRYMDKVIVDQGRASMYGLIEP